MKSTLKTAILLLVGTLILTTAQAYESDDIPEELSMEQQERHDAKEAKMNAKIEAKKEKIRTRLEARGMEYDEIEEYLSKLFERLENDVIVL